MAAKLPLLKGETDDATAIAMVIFQAFLVGVHSTVQLMLLQNLSQS